MTSAIGLYAADEYWIKDRNDIHHKVEYMVLREQTAIESGTSDSRPDVQ